MFLGIEWFWWVVIVVAVVISIPFKIKFLKWYNNKSKAEKKDKWGDE